MRLRGVVLAAGLGRRLRPLTRSVPKPLLPVAGTPLLALTLSALEEGGCEAVAINLFHQGEKISSHFGGRFGGMDLEYSWEEQLLGTLGALSQMEEFLAPADLVVVVNGDSLCHWPVRRLIELHRRSSAAVTLMVSSRPNPERFGGGVGVDASGRIVAFGPQRVHGPIEQRLVFAGAHVFSPSLVRRLERGPADFIEDLYEPLLETKGSIHALESSRRWHDLGTPARYLEGVCEWVKGRGPRALGSRTWISPEAKVSENATIKRAVVEAGAVVEEGVHIERALVLPGARVGAGALVRESIVGYSARLRPGTSVEGRMVTVDRADHPQGDRDSVVGGLVYSPLDG